MPAKDKYHDTVIRALKSDGWQILGENLLLLIENRHLWVDVEAKNKDDESVILVEIKTFENMQSPVNYLQSVIGQYMMYKVVLTFLEINNPLFLAVSLDAYNGFLQEEIAKQVIEQLSIKLVVIDIQLEEIVEWIP